MLTILGTGHVFNIGEPVAFLTRQCWPDAVCVELDPIRYHAMIGDKEAMLADVRAKGYSSVEEWLEDAPPVLKQSSKYQSKMSKENQSSAGADMVAGIGAAKSVDAEVFCIDIDAHDAMKRMWDDMSAGERLRYKLSGISDNLFGKRKVDKTQSEYSQDREAYVVDMRRKYPTLVRVLIDERNSHMANEIAKVCGDHNNVVAVMGDAHVDGVLKLLPGGLDVRVVRLNELMDPKRVKELKTKFWEAPEQ